MTVGAAIGMPPTAPYPPWWTPYGSVIMTDNSKCGVRYSRRHSSRQLVSDVAAECCWDSAGVGEESVDHAACITTVGMQDTLHKQ